MTPHSTGAVPNNTLMFFKQSTRTVLLGILEQRYRVCLTAIVSTIPTLYSGDDGTPEEYMKIAHYFESKTHSAEARRRRRPRRRTRTRTRLPFVTVPSKSNRVPGHVSSKLKPGPQHILSDLIGWKMSRQCLIMRYTEIIHIRRNVAFEHGTL